MNVFLHSIQHERAFVMYYVVHVFALNTFCVHFEFLQTGRQAAQQSNATDGLASARFVWLALWLVGIYTHTYIYNAMAIHVGSGIYTRAQCEWFAAIGENGREH